MGCGGAEVQAVLEEEKTSKKKSESLKEWEEFKKVAKKRGR
ncbi:MAG: hypothetical protein NQU48_01990 [Hadesarchaea archaeon]|jgi:hypothetical protein|nr:hypothetical protein [Hadesarchaea archaeon]